LYRLIVTDVDGTLLDSDSRMPELNREALLACKEQGMGIILATGKTMESIQGLVDDLDLKLPQITLNGSITVGAEGRVLDAAKIEAADYRDIVDFIKENGSQPVVALDDGKLYLEKYHPELKHLDAVGERFIEVDSIDTDRFACNTVDIFIPITESDPLDGALRRKYSGRLQFIRSGRWFFDILSIDATKGKALQSLAGKLGIGLQETVVLGDSPNDLSMFDIAGLKIAVKNSYPEILDKADIITDENYNSGLGKALNKYILKNT